MIRTHASTSADGTYVLKVANAGEDHAVLDLQLAMLRHLERTAPDLPVPRVVDTVDGAGYADVTGPNGAHRVRLVTHLDGDVLARVPRTPRPRTRTRPNHRAAVGRPRRLRPPGGAPCRTSCGTSTVLPVVIPWLDDVADPDDRAVVRLAFDRYEQRVAPVLHRLPVSVLHQDANDFNVLVRDDGSGVPRISGIIDFGDATSGRRVNELAVALAYALLDVPDVAATARRMIGGYTEFAALSADELRVLFDLVVARLAMSVVISSHRSAEFPDNEYLIVSRAPALRLLRRLTSMRPEFLHFVAREAAGLPAVPQHDAIVDWLRSDECRPVSPLPFDLHRAGRIVISLADGAPGMDVAADPVAYWDWLRREMVAADAVVAIGRYDEDRNCYAGDQFTTDAPETRSVHLGIDLFVEAETPLHAMLPGTVVTVVDNDLPFDYGPTVIVRHEAGDGRAVPRAVRPPVASHPVDGPPRAGGRGRRGDRLRGRPHRQRRLGTARAPADHHRPHGRPGARARRQLRGRR